MPRVRLKLRADLAGYPRIHQGVKRENESQDLCGVPILRVNPILLPLQEIQLLAPGFIQLYQTVQLYLVPGL
jgi:hypothetical protein